MDCSYRTGTKGFHSTKKGNENDNSLKVSGFLPNLHLEESLHNWVQKTTCKWKGVKCPLSLKGFDSEWCSAKLEAYKNCKSTKNYQKCEIKLIRTSPEERINQGGKSTLRKVHFFHSETIGQGKLYIQHTYITSFVFHITHLAQRCLSRRKIPASHQRVGQRPRLLNIFCIFHCYFENG